MKNNASESWVWINEVTNCLKIIQEFWIEYGSELQELPSIDKKSIIENLETTWEEVDREIDRHKKIQEKLIKVNNHLHELCTIDGLTSVANRYQFNNYLNKEWKRSQRDRRSISLIMCDVDYFKKYNDEYGHQGGDECLRKVAQAIAGVVQRPADLVARYGGEEFVVILPETDLTGAKHVGEIICKAVEQLQIPHAKSDVSKYVTLSVGVSTIIPTPEANPEDLISWADEALYKSKKSGRNCVKVYVPKPIINEKNSILISLLCPNGTEPMITWCFEKESLIRIGRARNNDIILHSAMVSRYHLKLRLIDRQWKLSCFGQNPTYLGNQAIDQVMLKGGEIIQLACGPVLKIELPSKG